MSDAERLGVLEALGMVPVGTSLRQAWRGLRGDPNTPPHKWGLSSWRALRGWKSIRAWLGRERADRRIPVFNLFNRVGREGGAHSVRSTYARDFRGLRQTYDGHFATDFIVLIGTPVVAPAPGRVLRVAREWDRGGLHVLLDHGDGLVTDGAHLGRALVRVGQVVARGEPIALSGVAGMDLIIAFPWNPPHLHFNVWLGGAPVDPFAQEGTDEVSIWRKHNDPVPHVGPRDERFRETAWDEAAIARGVEACLDDTLRAHIASRPTPAERAAELLFHWNYRPTRFREAPRPYREADFERRSMIDLPFSGDRFSGVSWA